MKYKISCLFITYLLIGHNVWGLDKIQIKKALKSGYLVPVKTKQINLVHEDEEFGPTDKAFKTGFPDSAYPDTTDPVNYVTYQNVVVGRTFTLAWNEFNNPFSENKISFYRYVTVYNSNPVKEFQIPNFPSFQSNCEDGWNFSSWSQEYSQSISFQSTAGVSSVDLGFKMEYSRTETNIESRRFERRASAIKGKSALYTLYGQAEDWMGVTYIQWYDSRTGVVGYLKPSLINKIEEILKIGGYPWHFFLNNQNFKFIVKKSNIEECPAEKSPSTPTTSTTPTSLSTIL